MAEPDHKVRVWDAPTRLFHWAVVMLTCASWFSADQGYMKVHLVSGLTLLALILFRIGWGLLGSTTARFRDFLHSPRKVIGYLNHQTEGARIFYAGHNPAGGWMVAAMLAVLLAQVLTGLFGNDGLKFSGPLALLVSVDVSDAITRIHGVIFNIILLLVWLHLAAVGFYYFVKGDNLVVPMVTGRKRHDRVPEGLALMFAHPLLALGLLAVTAALAASLLL
jgi:cytochrome b